MAFGSLNIGYLDPLGSKQSPSRSQPWPHKEQDQLNPDLIHEMARDNDDGMLEGRGSKGGKAT